MFSLHPLLTKRSILITSWAVVLLISLALFFFWSPSREVVIHFPMDDMETIEGEIRKIPRVHAMEEQMEQYVREMLLQPVSVHLNPIVPQGVNINFFRYDRSSQSLFIDFTSNLMIVERVGQNYLDDEPMLTLLRKNIQRQFPFLKKIYITIDGKVPFSPLYSSF